MHDASWKKIFDDYKIHSHDFSKGPFSINAEQIKKATKDFSKTGEKEVRILCKQDYRDKRPKVFIDNNLFLLPVTNGKYVIIKGEGYVDIPEITSEPIEYNSKLDFELKTSKIGNSEMQHLDYAYASSLIRTFTEDPSLVLTIRGRKYTPEFEFKAGKPEIGIKVQSVQTEVDAGYEGKDQVVLIEAKNSKASDVIIRQLYYPFRQWSISSGKKVRTLFFEKHGNKYEIWEFGFSNPEKYNSIQLVKSATYKIST